MFILLNEFYLNRIVRSPSNSPEQWGEKPAAMGAASPAERRGFVSLTRSSKNAHIYQPKLIPINTELGKLEARKTLYHASEAAETPVSAAQSEAMPSWKLCAFKIRTPSPSCTFSNTEGFLSQWQFLLKCVGEGGEERTCSLPLLRCSVIYGLVLRLFYCFSICLQRKPLLCAAI